MLDLNSKSMLSARINCLIDDAIFLEHAWDPPREYLGASVVGHSCDRHVQYRFLVTRKEIPDPPIEPRIRRIFDRGNLYEDRARKWLSAAGFEFYPDPNGISDFDDRFRGHVDGVIVAFKGPVASPIDLPALWECKALGSKGWKALEKDGLQKYSSTYWGQAHIYMAYLELHRCLYTVVNADTMELLHLLIEFDPKEAETIKAKIARVFTSTDMGELLPRISQDPAYFVCTMCPFRDNCWK